MLKSKWARSGRDQLGKDLGEIEQALCLVSKQQPSPLAPTLVPVFLSLRRTFLLPTSPLPPKLVDAFIDLLPPPPDGDDVPFREPSIQTATNALYVNPRLNDSAAFEVLQELIVYEKEILDERGMGDGVPPALVQVLEHVQKRVRLPPGRFSSPLTWAVSGWILRDRFRDGQGACTQQCSTDAGHQAAVNAPPRRVAL